MAKDKTATVTTDPPDTSDFIEADLPKGVSLDDLPVPEAEAPAKAEPGKPAKPEAEAQEPDRRPPAKVVPAQALQEERDKRKKATSRANLYEAIVRGRDRIVSPRPSPTQPDAKPRPAIEGERLHKFRQQIGGLRTEIERTYPELGPVMGRLGDEVAALVTDLTTGHERLEKYEKALVRADIEIAHMQRIKNRRIQVQERALKRVAVDWDERLKEAGLFQACWQDPDTGAFGDPEIAYEIYAADNPPLHGYLVALDKLRLEGSLSRRDYETAIGRLEAKGLLAPVVEDDDDTGGEGQTGDVQPAAKATPAAPAKAEEAREAGKREGRAEVAAVVADNSTRHRGIRHLKPAGEGRAGLSRDYLDWLMDNDYQRYTTLIEANGGKQGKLYRWHHGGVE